MTCIDRRARSCMHACMTFRHGAAQSLNTRIAFLCTACVRTCVCVCVRACVCTLIGPGDSGATALGHVLRINKHLQGLSLNKNFIGDDGAVAIAEGLQMNDKLGILYLVRNGLTNVAMQAFKDTIAKNEALTMLNFAENQIDDDGVCAIAEGLKLRANNQDRLETIDLDHNLFEDRGAACLADALTDNKFIKWLDLNKNRIGGEGK